MLSLCGSAPPHLPTPSVSLVVPHDFHHPHWHSPLTAPGRAGAVDSGRRVVSQEVVDLAVPLAHDAGDRARPRLGLG